jgi:hypothetical protein
MATQVEQIPWQTSLPQAKEQAAQQGRAILLDFSAAPE